MEEKEFLNILEEKLKSYEALVYEREQKGLLEKKTLKTYLTHSTILYDGVRVILYLEKEM